MPFLNTWYVHLFSLHLWQCLSSDDFRVFFSMLVFSYGAVLKWYFVHFFCRDDCIWVSMSTRSFFTHSICCEHVNIKKHKHMLLHWMQHWVRRRKCHKKNHLTQANNQTLLLRFKSFNTSLSGFEMSFSFQVFHSKERLICIIIMALFSKNWSTCSSQGKIGYLTSHGFFCFFQR